MDNLCRTFYVLSDPNRLKILGLLKIRPLFVCEISKMLGLAFSTTSQHLHILQDAGFITSKKEGRWIQYHLERNTSNPYVNKLCGFICEFSAKQDDLKIDRANLDRICEKIEREKDEKSCSI